MECTVKRWEKIKNKIIISGIYDVGNYTILLLSREPGKNSNLERRIKFLTKCHPRRLS